MKKQYRIINKGKGVLKITPSNLNEVEQPLTEIEALYDYVNNQDGEVLLNSKAYTNNSLITINTNITELEDKIALLELPNEILTRGAVVLVDNAIKILPYAFTVRINQKRLSNPLAYSVPINPTTIGYNRIDIITIDSFGIFTKLQGEESLSTAIKPQPLADTLEVTSINITGNVISPPVITDTAKLDRGGYTGGSAMTLYQEITALDEAITTRIDDIVYEVVEISLPLKEDKNQKGVANGYVPLNEFTKIALQYLNVVNNLVDGGTNSLLTAEQGKQLQLQVSAIQNILFSDNVNLDTVQEIVDALENVQSYIDTILVNDLTTGGITKALTAEMGKVLKTAIDDIYQPDVLISSVAPTRSVNTFTYPAGQYTYLISKTLRTLIANYVVAIDAATASNLKRVDLIQGKVDGTFSKKIGTENAIIAIRPEPDANCVPISFINVFGNTIEEPTSITKEISIQDSLGKEQFKIADYLRFRGASFNITAKQIEIDPLVGGVIFVSNLGNDSTAEPENRSKPYKTLDAAITAYWAYSTIDYINIISNTDFDITVSTTNNTNRKFEIRSEKTCRVFLKTNGALTANPNGQNQPFTIYLPVGSLYLVPTIGSGLGGGGDGRAIVNIEASYIEVNNLWNLNGSNIISFYLKAKTLTIISNTAGLTSLPGGTVLIDIDVNTINFRGNCSLLGNWVSANLSFKIITHDNTFKLNNASTREMNIKHGSITSIAPYVNTTKIAYLTKTLMNVEFSQGATIASNVYIQCFNTTGVLTLTGVCNYTNSDFILSGYNSPTQPNQVFIKRANITCKMLFGGGNWLQNIQIEDSTIVCLTPYLGNTRQSGGTPTYADPTVTFVGTNYVFTSIQNSNMLQTETYWVGTNVPTINIEKGILYTNAKFDRTKVVIKENPLNQYYDTIERQKVLVDEKQEIINKVLDSTKTYVINGVITLLAGEYIEVPATGLTISGYGYDTSGFNKNVINESIFKSPITNSGNVTLKDCFFNSGLGSVFNLIDIDGSHAIEINNVNFIGCAYIGKLKGYRQFTGTTCGIYSCKDGIQISGNWSGFKLTNSNIINFIAGGTLIKKDVDTLFSNRLYLDINFSCQTGAKLSDFDATNFASDELFQINNTLAALNGTKDASINTPLLLPNITSNNSKARFTNNLGITNSAMKFQDLKSPDGTVWRLTVSDTGVTMMTSI